MRFSYGGVCFFLPAFYFEFILGLGNSLCVQKKNNVLKGKQHVYIVPWIKNNISRVQKFLLNVKKT